MASGVHAVALRLKQAKKKKLLLDQQQQQLGLKPPLDKVTSVRIVEPTRSPRRSYQGWDANSDVSGAEGKSSNADHRQMADKAYKKWRNKQKAATSLSATVFRKSYIAAGQSNHFDLFLWFGLSVLLTGTIISFVGLGEKGFRTSYLRLLGPVLCGFGLAVVIIRIGICCINGRRKKVSANCHVRDQLAKVVTVQHAVAVRSIQYKPGEGPAVIPSIQIDPSCDSAMMKSSVTAATDLSPSEGRSPVLSGENVPLIDIESADNTPSPQLTTVVIESEWMSEKTVETRQVHFAGIPRKSRIPSHPELALNPLSLAAHDSISSSSLISPLPKSWSAGFDADNS
ncbi:hypothetical protein DAPPUDRAFT_322302 [Daphnia pulex]|uniref:Uncharacterized protein n=1 Tax=Daphnia pulex TaxID=6669 RepID=E9GVI4_DAPPU|nr:hypothetical protein DAPPUDRAFT_322302 [Daphnia pulex]|eukprot:EFX76420.1 hypothetical protein DAPPUDRAFT_322302 [Daphnia pulex]